MKTRHGSIDPFYTSSTTQIDNTACELWLRKSRVNYEPQCDDVSKEIIESKNNLNHSCYQKNNKMA